MKARGEITAVRSPQARAEWLMAGISLAGIVVAWLRWNSLWALGFAVGAALSWLNYRWLKKGVMTIVPAPSHAPGEPLQTGIDSAPASKPRTSWTAFAKFFGRYVLLIGALYAILSYSLLPAGAFLVGLFTAVAAVLIAFLYELVS